MELKAFIILFIVETMFEEAPSSTLRDPRAPVALRDHIWNDITGSLECTLRNIYTMHLNATSYTFCVQLEVVKAPHSAFLTFKMCRSTRFLGKSGSMLVTLVLSKHRKGEPLLCGSQWPDNML